MPDDLTALTESIEAALCRGGDEQFTHHVTHADDAAQVAEALAPLIAERERAAAERGWQGAVERMGDNAVAGLPALSLVELRDANPHRAPAVSGVPT